MSHIYPFPLSHSNLRTILALSSLYDYWKCVVCSQWSLELRWEINPGYPLGVADAWGLAHHLLPPRMVISRKVERELSRHFAMGCRHPTKALSTTPNGHPPFLLFSLLPAGGCYREHFSPGWGNRILWVLHADSSLYALLLNFSFAWYKVLTLCNAYLECIVYFPFALFQELWRDMYLYFL